MDIHIKIPFNVINRLRSPIKIVKYSGCIFITQIKNHTFGCLEYIQFREPKFHWERYFEDSIYILITIPSNNFQTKDAEKIIQLKIGDEKPSRAGPSNLMAEQYSTRQIYYSHILNSRLDHLLNG